MKKLLLLLATLSSGSIFAADYEPLPIDTQSLNNLAQQMWADPAFREKFIGSYVPLQAVEPEFSTEEKIVLKEELVPILQGPNPAQAIPSLRELSMKEGASAQIDFLLGNIYLQSNRTAEAERAYMAAVKKFPNYRRAWKNLGMIYMVTGDYRKALEPITKSIELGDVTGDNYGYLGVVYMQMEDYVSAESAFRSALMMQPKKKQWKDNLFKTMLLQERYEEAGSVLRTMISEEPNNEDYWKYLANVYVGLEKPLEAAEVLEIRDRMGRSDAQSLEMLANIYFNHALYDVAYDVYERALNSTGARFSMLYNSANALAAVGEYQNSLALVDQLRSRFESSIEKSERIDLLVLEASAKRAMGNFDEAAEILEKIILEDPMNGRALIELGLYYKNLEEPDYQEAISLFKKAENVQEYAAAAYLEHAKILVSPQGKYKEAVRLLRRAQELEYKEYVQDYLERVERVAKRY